MRLAPPRRRLGRPRGHHGGPVRALDISGRETAATSTSGDLLGAGVADSSVVARHGRYMEHQRPFRLQGCRVFVGWSGGFTAGMAIGWTYHTPWDEHESLGPGGARPRSGATRRPVGKVVRASAMRLSDGWVVPPRGAGCAARTGHLRRCEGFGPSRVPPSSCLRRWRIASCRRPLRRAGYGPWASQEPCSMSALTC